MKSSAVRQKARLPAALASLNNDHSSDLYAYCASVRSSSRPNFVPTTPLHPQSMAWQSSLVTNLSSTALVVEVEARGVTGCYRVAMTTLARNVIWPCNSSMLSRSFSISPSLASKPVRHKLSLRSSCLGASARVSTT